MNDLTNAVEFPSASSELQGMKLKQRDYQTFMEEKENEKYLLLEKTNRQNSVTKREGEK